MKIASNISCHLARKPKLLFLIDSTGAMFTALSLFAVSKNFHECVGLYTEILTFLSAIAACFCLYSAACFLFLKGSWTSFIKGIIAANLLYCSFTTGLLVIYYRQLTIIGMTYFLVEIVLICGLVCIEFNTVKIIKKQLLINTIH